MRPKPFSAHVCNRVCNGSSSHSLTDNISNYVRQDCFEVIAARSVSHCSFELLLRDVFVVNILHACLSRQAVGVSMLHVSHTSLMCLVCSLHPGVLLFISCEVLVSKVAADVVLTNLRNLMKGGEFCLHCMLLGPLVCLYIIQRASTWTGCAACCACWPFLCYVLVWLLAFFVNLHAECSMCLM